MRQVAALYVPIGARRMPAESVIGSVRLLRDALGTDYSDFIHGRARLIPRVW